MTTQNPSATSAEGVSIGSVEKTLDTLWSQIAEAEGDSAVLRVTTINLVLHTHDTQSAHSVIADMLRAYPCRAIVIEPVEAAQDSATIEATPTIFCAPTLAARTQVCCEEIVIRVGENAMDRAAAAVRNLLLPDLPVYVYHNADDSLLPLMHGLHNSVNAVIIDSAALSISDLANIITTLPCPVLDLNWQRLLTWRQSIARHFDAAPDELQTIHSVTITHGKTDTTHTQAMLLLGWMMSRLGWQLYKKSERQWLVRSGGHDQRDISLRVNEVEGTDVEEVSIKTDSRTITLSLTTDDTCIISPEAAAQRLPDRKVGSLIGALVDRTRRDPIFHDAVHAALSLTSGGPVMYQVPMIVTENAQSLARLAARYFIQIAREAIDRRGRFTVSLSGGTTPRLLYSLLAEPPYCDEIDWQKIYVFWGDERDVPITHPDSDQRMSYETLLNKVPIPPTNIFNIRTGQMSTTEAAVLYATDVAQFFGIKPGEIPEFDLILLGFGADGHTASLFPNTPALDAHGLVVHNDVPQLNTTRVTFTFDLINNANNIILLGSGSSKADMVAEIVTGTPGKYPVQRIKPTDGTLTLMLDQDAATKVKARL